MKVLNLYSGIGGNRKLWTDCQVTAVELNPQIAEIYKGLYPDDEVIIGDAHQYLIDHYTEYDFIWSSPPCPTHSRIQLMSVLSNSVLNRNRRAVYPDMTLYQEIILLKSFALKETRWVVENVIPYYRPLIEGVQLGRHLFWLNFPIRYKKIEDEKEKVMDVTATSNRYGFDLSSFSGIDKRKTLRNCVNPKLALHIYNEAKGIISYEESDLFQNIL